jgi:hypothetical protein
VYRPIHAANSAGLPVIEQEDVGRLVESQFIESSGLFRVGQDPPGPTVIQHVKQRVVVELDVQRNGRCARSNGSQKGGDPLQAAGRQQSQSIAASDPALHQARRETAA